MAKVHGVDLRLSMKASRVRRLVGGALLCGMLTVPAAANSLPVATPAGCGGVETAGPAHWHRDYRAPLAIGDSTMLLSLPALSSDGFSVNARGCRQYPEALSLLGALRHAHQLPHLVVIALGANGEITEGDVNQALDILGEERLLVLVTPRELGGGSGSDARLVRAEGRRHPERIRVLDWVAYSADHPDWFEADGLHLTPTGAAALARFLDRVRPLGPPPRSVRVPKCPAPTSIPEMVPTAIELVPTDRILDAHPPSSHVQLGLVNPNQFPLSGLVRVSEETSRRLTVAARCFSVPASGTTKVALTLAPRVLTDLELGHDYRVGVQLDVPASQGSGATVSAKYLLREAPR